MLKIRLPLAVVALAVVLSAGVVSAQDSTPPVTSGSSPQTPAQVCDHAVPAADPATRTYSQAEQVLQPGVDYRAIFCTDVGPIYVDLFEDLTPVTVNSFVFLAQNGYYNNTTFHRVIQDFMAQGGDPTATGTGGPGYQFQDEIVGFLNFDQPGWLAMANAGADTNGSQFFITTAPYPSLDGHYSIFGDVLEGQANVQAIRLRDPQTDTQPGTTINTVVIVTDPSSIITTHESPVTATQDAVAAVINRITGSLPQQLIANPTVTGIKTADDVVAAAPESVRAAYTTLLSDNHFQYRGGVEVDNPTCDIQNTPYYSLSYTLDSFASPADASAVLETARTDSGVLYQAATESGYAPISVQTSLPYPVFVGVQSACGQDMTKALTYWQRGSFVVTAAAVFPQGSSVTADVWLQRLVGAQVFENLFSDVLRTTLP